MLSCQQYLFQRLHQVGVRSVHGLPGDYNLVALDYLSKAELRWVGNCNELNAGMLTFDAERCYWDPAVGFIERFDSGLVDR